MLILFFFLFYKSIQLSKTENFTNTLWLLWWILPPKIKCSDIVLDQKPMAV